MGLRLGLVLALVASAFSVAEAQTLYKYRGPDGEWIYTDRKPPEEAQAETRNLTASFSKPSFAVTHDFTGSSIELHASNQYFVPMELRIRFNEIKGVQYPDPDKPLRWVVPPRSELQLVDLGVLGGVEAPFVDYGYEYLIGDPDAKHVPNSNYLAPFAVGRQFPITQAYPETVTHGTLDSVHAVDIAMPIGTDVLAARGGVVFDVAADNYSGGIDPAKKGSEANYVRILHEDGTFSLYAHLNWNTIRVKPGDRVRAGDYIADSGNTGFSTGPHLHFAVQRNIGMQIESLPVVFRGPNAAAIVPTSGEQLSGYR